MMNKLVSGIALALFVTAGIYSCKDMGHAPARAALSASTVNVVLNPGGSIVVAITGGNPPYTISRPPDNALATATLVNKTDGTADLTIQATSANVSGTTRVKIKDRDTHGSAGESPDHEENEIEIEIRISGGGGGGGGVSFSTQVQPIFTTSCVNAGCHPGSGAPFSLRSDNAYANLVNVAATTGPCAGDLRVSPGNAAASALVKRLEGTCGVRMPIGGAALSQAELDLIKSWINQGALNN